MGFEPRPYTEDTIEGIASRLDRLCAAFGVTKESVAKGVLPEEQVGPDPTAIEAAFRAELERMRAAVLDEFSIALDFDVTFESVDVDAYWSYWVDGAGLQYRLRFNRSNRAYGRSEVTQFVLHELLGHCGQASKWYNAPGLSNFARLLSVHTYEQVHLEGFGQGLPLLLQATRDTLTEVRAVYVLLREMVLNNAYLDLALGKPIEGVVDAATRHLPVVDYDRLLKNLAAQVHQPIMRTYMFSYPKGIELVSLIAQHEDAASASSINPWLGR